MEKSVTGEVDIVSNNITSNGNVVINGDLNLNTTSGGSDLSMEINASNGLVIDSTNFIGTASNNYTAWKFIVGASLNGSIIQAQQYKGGNAPGMWTINFDYTHTSTSTNTGASDNVTYPSIQFSSYAYATPLQIMGNGWIGINNRVPTTYPLEVNGDIWASNNVYSNTNVQASGQLISANTIQVGAGNIPYNGTTGTVNVSQFFGGGTNNADNFGKVSVFLNNYTNTSSLMINFPIAFISVVDLFQGQNTKSITGITYTLLTFTLPIISTAVTGYLMFEGW